MVLGNSYDDSSTASIGITSSHALDLVVILFQTNSSAPTARHRFQFGIQI